MKKLQDDIKFGIGEEVSLKEGYYLYGIKAGDKGIVRDYKAINASYLYLISFGTRDTWLYAHQVEGKEEPTQSKKEHSLREEVLIKSGKYSGRKGVVRGKGWNADGKVEYYVEAHYPGRNPDGEDNIVLLEDEVEAIKEDEVEAIKEDVEAPCGGRIPGSDHELDRNHFMLLRNISRNLKPDMFNNGLHELEQWGYVLNLGFNNGFYVLTEIGKQALKEKK